MKWHHHHRNKRGVVASWSARVAAVSKDVSMNDILASSKLPKDVMKRYKIFTKSAPIFVNIRRKCGPMSPMSSVDKKPQTVRRRQLIETIPDVGLRTLNNWSTDNLGISLYTLTAHSSSKRTLHIDANKSETSANFILSPSKLVSYFSNCLFSRRLRCSSSSSSRYQLSWPWVPRGRSRMAECSRSQHHLPADDRLR